MSKLTYNIIDVFFDIEDNLFELWLSTGKEKYWYQLMEIRNLRLSKEKEM